ncbi:MAG: hypothetical protein AB1638_13015 [Nitrospirota bacterium]
MKIRRFLKFCFFALTFLSSTLAIAGIKETKHNLSASGLFSVRAVEETQICIFCHTPHNSYPAQPLWNHELSAVQTYRSYWSETLQSYSQAESEAWPIDGYSKLCLSCHDGTVAVGAVYSRFEDILMVSSPCIDASGKLIDVPECTGYIGTDLSGGHPLSIKYNMILVNNRNSNTEFCRLNPPPLGDPYVKLYPTKGEFGVQCTSCHDPHTNRSIETRDGKPWPPFWQKETHDAVCEVCHVKDCQHDWPW